jgi:hypothetical protein
MGGIRVIKNDLEQLRMLVELDRPDVAQKRNDWKSKRR